jgi:hypothetical protein
MEIISAKVKADKEPRVMPMRSSMAKVPFRKKSFVFSSIGIELNHCGIRFIKIIVYFWPISKSIFNIKKMRHMITLDFRVFDKRPMPIREKAKG